MIKVFFSRWTYSFFLFRRSSNEVVMEIDFLFFFFFSVILSSFLQHIMAFPFTRSFPHLHLFLSLSFHSYMWGNFTRSALSQNSVAKRQGLPSFLSFSFSSWLGDNQGETIIFLLLLHLGVVSFLFDLFTSSLSFSHKYLLLRSLLTFFISFPISCLLSLFLPDST
ncbi:unnamed protein product [Acanthosepion pharaonis]|uniref:Uncharacterized protein n=1 Tax=Acanthosepion pharaonis TaxID=158019 RepID=A0A812EPG0_ACAPH|nr:unnamed protein product [Sepia pharaonis]